MHTAVDHRYALLSHSLEGSSQPREAVGDGGIVLDVLVSIEVAGQLLRGLAHQDIGDELCDERLVSLGLI